MIFRHLEYGYDKIATFICTWSVMKFQWPGELYSPENKEET